MKGMKNQNCVAEGGFGLKGSLHHQRAVSPQENQKTSHRAVELEGTVGM